MAGVLARCVAVLLVLMTAACGVQPGEVAAPADPSGGAGDPTLAAVLARYEGRDARTVALEVPDVIGLTPAAADAALADAGLVMQLVALDPTQPVTAQFPGPREPAPLDGSVEVWLGTAAVATPTASPTPSPSPTASATPFPTPTPTSQQVTVTHVLPPHTPGRLRINPRFLPAVPAGTVLDGTASWYGPGFHGKRTACGGIYDQNGPTLATRELRCGTVVRITGPTGLTVEATVTDWGPAEWAGRRFDLSAAVFNAIAPLSSGVIPVRVITVNEPR